VIGRTAREPVWPLLLVSRVLAQLGALRTWRNSLDALAGRRSQLRIPQALTMLATRRSTHCQRPERRHCPAQDHISSLPRPPCGWSTIASGRTDGSPIARRRRKRWRRGARLETSRRDSVNAFVDPARRESHSPSPVQLPHPHAPRKAASAVRAPSGPDSPDHRNAALRAENVRGTTGTWVRRSWSVLQMRSSAP
jgi:hypothetical protein